MNIRQRLVVSILTLVAVTVGVAAVQIWEDRAIERGATRLAHSSLWEMRAGWGMLVALERVEDAARSLSATPRPSASEGAGPGEEAGAPEPGGQPETSEALERELLDALGEFETLLATARSANARDLEAAAAAKDQAALSGERQELEEWLIPAAEELSALRAHAHELLRRLDPDAERGAAGELMDEVVEPLLRERLIPLVEAYGLDAEQEVEGEAAEILAAIRQADRVVTAAALAGMFLAPVLIFVVYRSISRPLGRLHEAARRLAGGDLQARVGLPARGELGLLAAAFDRMAEKLSQTMVSKDHLDGVLESMAGALFLVGSDGAIERGNRAAAQLLRCRRRELIGRSFDALCSGERESITLQIAVEGYVRNLERSLRCDDGSEVAVALSGAALRDRGGEIVGYVCLAHDVSRQKAVERRIRASLEEKELLLRELHHRVKNNLQVVSSLLDLQSAYLTDPRALEMFRESQNRIRAMALVHEQLYRTVDLDRVEFLGYVERLCTQLFRSYGALSDRIALRFRVDEQPLDVDQALACGLIVNELVSNALRHAFADGSAGEVCVEFGGAGDGRLRLAVVDNGRGLAKDFSPQGADSLGLNLVATLVKQLRGTFAFHSNGGTEFRIEFPAAAAGAAAGADRG